MELLSEWPLLLSLVVTGLSAGLLAGLLGVGGGIVIVPVLFFLFQQFDVSAASAMPIATGTSLATIIPTSISSLRAHNKRGNVDFALLRTWGPRILVGVLAGSWLVTRVDGFWFTLLFGSLAVLVSANMLLRANAPALAPTLPGVTGQTAMAGSIGFFSSMVGIGGGTLSVPLLTAFSYPAHRAVGTAAAIGLLISLPGATALLLLGTAPADAPAGTFGLVNLPALACIIPLSILTAPLGAALAQRLNPARLKQVFAVVLAFTGARMLLQVLG